MKTLYALITTIGVLFIYSNQLFAQVIADTLWLEEVQVQATRVNVQDRYQPVRTIRIDSAEMVFLGVRNLDAVLEAASPAFVRSNGPGGLSSFSIRGFSSSQTQVLWNGFQINHAMLGTTDLSLIPSFALQDVVVSSGDGNTGLGEKGGGTVAFTSRSLGDNIMMKLKSGSFGEKGMEAGLGFTVNRWNFDVLLGATQANNDFTYKVTEFSNEARGFIEVEKKRANNAQNYQTGILSASRAWNHSTFSTMIWAYDSENDIPGSISGLSNDTRQDDAYVRWMSKYVQQIDKHTITAKTYVNTQKLDYFDISSDIESLSNTLGFVGDLEWKTNFFERIQSNIAVQVARNSVDANEYQINPVRDQISFSANPIWLPIESLHLFGGLRGDYYSDFDWGQSWKLGFNYHPLGELLFLHGQASRNFVTPTFNDLYWPELGDPNLIPEKIWKQEIGVRLNVLDVVTDFTVYQGRVEDGIRWLPGDDGQSRPLNLEETEMSGFELSGEYTIRRDNFYWLMKANVNHNLAAFTEARYEGDPAVGKQLRYTPEWQYKFFTSLRYKAASVAYSHTFVDERYASSDHSSVFDPLPAYESANLTFSARVNIAKTENEVSFSIFNLFDEDYEIIRSYPMPGRYFQLSFKTNIKYKDI